MATTKKPIKKVEKTEEKKMVDELIEESTPEVEITKEEPVEEEPKVKVTINKDIDDSKMPEQFVKIKMREDHKCFIGKERYILKKGQCYNVPKEVKMRLSKAELLLPL